ncbi:MULTISPECIES: LPS assembly lipoprotein LptE [unclassified Sphingomonas]|uniref:LPS assembly lipoprotein LptE n=1 Tax=unclassified Sphingomonas TaxID=196159 RepID=UPI0022B45460|nr:LPS assembly lipoprotein LptE [Sphingomonas sp. NIBR02145]WHU01560.1 LPS assembly lipoprotein LptE [Sphingomonas sp. NIBR02145]
MKHVALLVAGALALSGSLSGCGLRPLYGGGPDGAVRSTLSAVEVAPIQGQSGWLVANALKDRLDHNDVPARFRLEVKLDDQISGLGVKRDDSVARERRTLRARYQLIDLSNGNVVLDATAGSDAGIDVVGSEYATIAAEKSALERLSGIVADQIVARVARYAQTAPGAGGQ